MSNEIVGLFMPLPCLDSSQTNNQTASMELWNCFVWRERKKLKFIEWTAEHTLRAGCWKSILCFEWCLSRFPSHYSMAAIVYFSFVSSSVNVFPYTAANEKKTNNSTRKFHNNPKTKHHFGGGCVSFSFTNNMWRYKSIVFFSLPIPHYDLLDFDPHRLPYDGLLKCHFIKGRSMFGSCKYFVIKEFCCLWCILQLVSKMRCNPPV